MSKTITARSPGRINLIGEHTDYNGGFVLPGAIDKEITVCLQTNGSSGHCTLRALDLGEVFTFSLKEIKPQPTGWENYLLGMVHEFQQLGARISGFDAEVKGNIPIGSGMSSSAALECSMGFALNELFDLGIDKPELVYAAQRAEHGFVGTKCGIMDMFASVMGKKDHVIRLDCRTMEYDHFPLELGEYELLLLNTNVSHSLAFSAYNTRREECEEGVRILQRSFPEVRQLRDVTLGMLKQAAGDLPQPIARRCRHVVTENQRVLEVTQGLEVGDLARAGRLMYDSHESLRHAYEVSCSELDFLVDQTKSRPEVLGSRLMGGGFGGCTINLIERVHREQLIEVLAEAYHRAFGLELTPYPVRLVDGTSLVEES